VTGKNSNCCGSLHVEKPSADELRPLQVVIAYLEADMAPSPLGWRKRRQSRLERGHAAEPIVKDTPVVAFSRCQQARIAALRRVANHRGSPCRRRGRIPAGSAGIAGAKGSSVSRTRRQRRSWQEVYGHRERHLLYVACTWAPRLPAGRRVSSRRRSYSDDMLGHHSARPNPPWDCVLTTTPPQREVHGAPGQEGSNPDDFVVHHGRARVTFRASTLRIALNRTRIRCPSDDHFGSAA